MRVAFPQGECPCPKGQLDISRSDFECIKVHLNKCSYVLNGMLYPAGRIQASSVQRLSRDYVQIRFRELPLARRSSYDPS